MSSTVAYSTDGIGSFCCSDLSHTEFVWVLSASTSG